jgi:hypothetical protein
LFRHTPFLLVEPRQPAIFNVRAAREQRVEGGNVASSGSPLANDQPACLSGVPPYPLSCSSRCCALRAIATLDEHARVIESNGKSPGLGGCLTVD